VIKRLTSTDRSESWEMQKMVIPPQLFEIQLPLRSQATSRVGGALLSSEHWTDTWPGRGYEDEVQPVRERKFSSDRDLPRPPGEREERLKEHPAESPKIEIKPPL
jgi:hypothetical protein